MWAGAVPYNSESSVRDSIFSAYPFQGLSVEIGHRPEGLRYSQHIINIKATLEGHRIVVTGEGDSIRLALAKACSELTERAALISTGDLYGATTSNGWSAHPEFQTARQHAVFELIERDAVLAQWYSSTPFLKIRSDQFPLDLKKWAASELSRSEFPELSVLISTKGLGPSVTCLLKNKNGFGVSGHASRATLRNAIESALAEACRAAHATLRREYWGDTFKLKNKTPGPVDPGAHSVYYAYHEPFPKWMEGNAISWTEADTLWRFRIGGIVESDFSFQTVLQAPIFAGFAKHPLAVELHWGSTDENLVRCSVTAQRLGEISINNETHIVS